MNDNVKQSNSICIELNAINIVFLKEVLNSNKKISKDMLKNFLFRVEDIQEELRKIESEVF